MVSSKKKFKLDTLDEEFSEGGDGFNMEIVGEILDAYQVSVCNKEKNR